MVNQDDTVYWTNVFVHTAVRALVLWPFVRYVGGVEGGRSVLTAVLAAGTFTAGQAVYERTTLPRFPLQGPPLVPAQAQVQPFVQGVVVDIPESTPP